MDKTKTDSAAPRICDGCNVRTPWEHRCFGVRYCDCPECREVDRLFNSTEPQ
jgi:hypothetical protein